MEGVCKQLRRLHVVKNFSLEHSVSITCDPSFSASNEIHVCIVSTSSHSVCHMVDACSERFSLIYSLQRALEAARKDASTGWLVFVEQFRSKFLL